MSSEDGERQVPPKRRRGPQACDQCRRKKIRCDGVPGSLCSNCRASHLDCTHSKPKKRGPKTGYSDGYVEDLELRIKQMEEMLKELKPDIDLDAFGSSSSRRPASALGSASFSDTASEGGEDDEDDLVHVELAKHFSKLELEHAPKRVFGPSSAFVLLRNAMMIKDECTGSDPKTKYNRRAEYWLMRPWQLQGSAKWTPTYTYPPTDLLMSLTDIYFAEINPFYPVLHGPTFRTSLANMLHLRNHEFGATVLLVCAIASRNSDDPRVFVDGDTVSAGWRYYEQVPILRQELYNPPTVYEMQFYALAGLYTHGTATPHAAWNLAGIGLRLCAENGVHRRKPDGYEMTVEDELKKRAFWCLIYTERIFCSFLGRPPMFHDEDHDIELPIECDDEYWTVTPSGHVKFNQPQGKPSYITFFIKELELGSIIHVAMRYLYTTKKSKALIGNAATVAQREEWEKRIVMQLDEGLRIWRESLPEHLKWPPPQNQNIIYLTQAAILQEYYHNTTLQVHRPFIHKQTSLSERALAICANASRECVRVLEVHFGSCRLLMPNTLMTTFMVGLMLMLNIWTARQSGIPVHAAREWGDVDICLRVLKAYEGRWQIAGRLWDLLNDLTGQAPSTTTPAPAQTLTATTSGPGQIQGQSPIAGIRIAKSARARTDISVPITKEEGYVSHPAVVTQQAPPTMMNPLDTSSIDQFFASFENANWANNVGFQDLNSNFVTPNLNTFTGGNDPYAYTDTPPTPWHQNAPVGFNLEDWGTYITSLGGFVENEHVPT